MNTRRLTIIFTRPWTWFFIIYLTALFMSWTLTAIFATPEQKHKYQKLITIETEEVEGTISYFHIHSDVTSPALPVVMLHDNVYQAEALVPLAEMMHKEGYEVIIPEYPGYGFTDFTDSRRLDEKAQSVEVVLDELNISEFHLVAHGLGGAVAFYLQDRGNHKPSSLALLSAKGALDVYLMGNHTLNRSLILLQFPVYWIIKNLTPHFGWIDYIPIGYSSIYSSYEMDLRPVRDMMVNFEQPAYILHGRDDHYIDLRTAIEHNRLLAQSELELLDGNQTIFREKAGPVSQYLAVFFKRAESGEVLTRSGASPERINASNEPFNPGHTSPLSGVSLFMFLLLLAFTTFVSEDIACIGAGLLVAKGLLAFLPAAAACFAGILMADVTIYWLGRLVGSPMLVWIPFRWIINEEDVRKAGDVFKESGLAIIFASRFIPGTRFPTYFSAGMIKARFSLFLLYFLLAILIWTPLLVGISTILGQQILDYFYLYQDYAVWIFISFILLMFIVLKFLLPLTTQSGRRILKVKFERIKRRVKPDRPFHN